MAGTGRRCPFRDRLAWIRRRTWSKQRGAKLRGSSNESDGKPDPVVKSVLRDGDATSKLALKVGGGGHDGTRSPKLGTGGHDVCLKRVVEVGDGGGGGGCGTNTGTCGCDGSPKHVVEVGGGGDDVSYSPMLGRCGRDRIRKRVVVEEGSSDGTCTLNLGSYGRDGSPKHVVEMGISDGIEQVSDGRNVCGRRIGRGRLRVDCEGQLYVLDSEAEDSALEESCHPQLHRGRRARGRRLAATSEVAVEEGTVKATAVAGGELTKEMVECMEVWLIGIEEPNREVLASMIKVALTSFYTQY